MIADQNKLKFIDAKTFSAMKNLKWLGVSGNECINEDFATPSSLLTMTEVIKGSCGFCDEPDTSICELKIQLRSCEREKSELRRKLKKAFEIAEELEKNLKVLSESS